MFISGDFNSNDFTSADSKALVDAFFASAHSKGVTGMDGESVMVVRASCFCKALGELCSSCYLVADGTSTRNRSWLRKNAHSKEMSVSGWAPRRPCEVGRVGGRLGGKAGDENHKGGRKVVGKSRRSFTIF